MGAQYSTLLIHIIRLPSLDGLFFIVFRLTLSSKIMKPLCEIMTSEIEIELFYSFTINLQTGAATGPRDDTALHMSVRPTDPVIVRNHYENKVWGTEERFGGCPIYPGQPFEILILAESTAFKVSHRSKFSCYQ